MARLAGLLALLLALVSPVTAARPEEGTVQWVRVRVADWKRDGPLLRDFDVAGVDRKAGTADIIARPGDLERLREAGFRYDLVKKLDPWGFEVQTLYHDPGEVSDLLAAYAGLYPTLARVVVFGTTEQGRPYEAIKISDNVMVEEDEPAVLFDFEHHAREVMMPEIGLDLVAYLLTNYGLDPQVDAWVDSTEIWVVVNHNPDGSNHVFTANDNWRKNRRDNGNGTFGVDPNRNYPFRWGDCDGSSGSSFSDLYRGPSAASEPETQAIMALAQEHRPVFNLTYHAFGELVLYPYGCGFLIPSDKTASEVIGHRLARLLITDSGSVGYEAGYSWAKLNVIDGESKSWFLGALGTLSYTVEASSSLAGGFLPDYATWRDSTVERARPGWQYILDRLDGPSIRGHATDACTAAPLEAVIGIDELPLKLDETPRTSEPLWGRYQRILTLGDYTLRASATGYHDRVHALEVRTTVVDREVALVPIGSFGVAPAGLTIDDSVGGDGDGRLDPGETAFLRVRAQASGEAVSGITAVIGTVDPYLTIVDAAASYPDLSAGSQADPSDDGFTVQADPAAPVDHDASLAIFFTATESLCDPVHFIDVRITSRRETCPAYVEPLDVDPGWAINNTDPSGWAFGAPLALASGKGPGAGATGSTVFGTNLDGFYGADARYEMVTATYDLRGITGAILEFQRWLSTEEGFDYGTVEASADGAIWELLWTGTATDREWVPMRLDASVMDGEPAARFRFLFESDALVTDGGFYLDDVSICGEAAPALSPASLLVQDDTANTACTDGDGDADAGEVVTLRLTVDNRGVADALGATASLISAEPSLEILGPVALALGDVPVGGQVVADFTARVDSSAGCATLAAVTAQFSFNGVLGSDGPAGELTLEVDGAGCDANTCAAACGPTQEVAGVATDSTGRVIWAPSADACHAVAGIGYRVFRATSAAPLVSPPSSFPADTSFADISLADADGSLLDAGLDDGDLPAVGGVFYYLVADVGTDGNRGPVGHYGG